MKEKMKNLVFSRKATLITTVTILVLGALFMIIGLHTPVASGFGVKVTIASSKTSIFNLTHISGFSKYNSLLDLSLTGASFLIIDIAVMLWTVYVWFGDNIKKAISK